MADNGISTLANKELRQKAKLELAAENRAATGRRAIYDLEELPSQYSTNSVVDNPNPDGLLEGRPWVDISRTNLQFYIDPSATASYPGTGTAITDLSTNGYTGINMLNGVGYSATDADGSWTFDGSNDYIDTNQSLAQSNSFTLLAWVKVTNAANYRMIISKEKTTGSPWNYRMYANITTGRLVGDIAPASGSGGSVTGTTNIANGAWHMVAFTRDVTADTLNAYVDGALETSTTDPTTAAITGSQEVWLGRSAFTQSGASPTGSYPFLGSMGEVMIYDRALSAAEIAITFRATRSRYGV